MNPLPVYQVLDKDTIKEEILPYLPTAKRGYKTKSCLEEIIQSILYKLKTGCQWHMLPVESLFSGVVLSYKECCIGTFASGLQVVIGGRHGVSWSTSIKTN